MTNPNNIRTYGGIYMDPFDADECEISIADIAHSLSLICRANGHVSHFYSVAQHCLNCEREAEARGLGERLRLHCLLHDAAECYLSDVVRPVKRRWPEFPEAERRLMDVIYKSLGVSPPEREEQLIIDEIDDALLYHEFLSLCGFEAFESRPLLCADLEFGERPPPEMKKTYISRCGKLLKAVGSGAGEGTK